MQMFRFREGPVLFGLFDHMFDTYSEVVERNNPEASVISRSPCVYRQGLRRHQLLRREGRWARHDLAGLTRFE